MQVVRAKYDSFGIIPGTVANPQCNAHYEMKFCRYLILAWCIVASARDVCGQMPPQRFSAITVRNGLPSNQILCIARDSLGFLWYGTSLGLVRHDGVHLDAFTSAPGSGPRLPSDGVAALHVDRNNVLWILTQDHILCTLDVRKPYAQQINSIAIPAGAQGSTSVNLVLDSGDGEILVIMRDWQVYAISVTDYQVRHVPLREDFTPYGIPLAGIAAYDRFWIGSDQGFYVFDRHKQGYKEIVLDTVLLPGERARPAVRAIERFGETGLLLGGARRRHESFYGLIAYDTQLQTCRRVDGEVSGIYTIADFAIEHIDRIGPHEYMLHAVTRGHFYFNFLTGQGDTVVHDRYGLNRLHTASINCWHATPGGHIICGSNQGVFTYDPAEHLFEEFYPYHKYNRFPNQLSSIYLDTHTNHLIIAANNVLFLYDIDRDSTLAELYLPRMTDEPIGNLTPQIIPLTDDSLLILSNQIFVVSIRTWQYRILPMPEVSSQTNPGFHRWINHTHTGGTPMDDIYFVKDHYLYRMTRAGLRIRHLPLIDKSGREITPVTRALVLDRDKNLWIATHSSVLYKVSLGDTARAHTYHVLDSSEVTVRDLWIDEDNGLWIGTAQRGLIYGQMDGDSILCTVYGKGHGLLTTDIYQMIPDMYGRIWMSTHYGISCFDRETSTFRNYGKQHGINFPHNMRTGKGRDGMGRLYLSQGIAITRFDPADFLRKEDPPFVFIKEFRILDSIVCAFWKDTSITLTWRQDKFSFRIGAVTPTHGFMNRYAYMLEHYHRDWVQTGTDDLLINFNNLPGGNYIFRVRAANHEGTWNMHGINIAIAVVPPFWETWWFGALVALMVIGGIVLAFFLRIRQIRRQELLLIRREVEIQTAERQRIARDLHDDIGAQLSTVNMYIEALRNGHTPTANETSGQLHDEAQQLIRRTIADMSQIITELSPQALSTYGYVAAVHEFLYHVRKSTNLEIQYDLSRFVSGLDATGEAALFRLTQELFNNTIKHAGAQKITFSIREVDGRAILLYSDDGAGFDAQKVQTGRGLHNIASRVKLIGGKIQFQSTPGHGVHYHIEFPNTRTS